MRRGYVIREDDVVIDASSTVSLVETGSKIILVDTGSLAELDGLDRALRGASVMPDSVHVVANTHLHMDHCGGNGLFTGAIFMAHRMEIPPTGTVRVAEGDVIVPGVSVMETPGHTAGCVSILVEAERRYAICGDAIPTRANYEAHVPPAIHIDRRMAVESMDRILSWADVVIPGHDAEFEVVRNK